MWLANTNPMNQQAVSAAVAAIPIFYLFWALAWKKMKGPVAATSTVGVTLLVAMVAFRMPAKLAFLAMVDGMLFGLWPMVWVVIAAVYLYNLCVETGQFLVIKNSLASLTADRRMQALLIAFAFGAFLEGAAGFGGPVAITAAMLAGLGFNPVYAAGLCLLANTAPVAFGSVGMPIIVAAQVSGVDQMAISQLVGRTLLLLSIAIPFYLVTVMSGFAKCREVWPACLVCGVSFGVTQCVTANYLGPMLPNIFSSIVAIISLMILLRFWHPREDWHFAGEPPGPGRENLAYTPGQILRAWAPYLIVSVMVTALGIKPIKAFLEHYTTFFIPICGLHDRILLDGSPQPALFKLNLINTPGTAILLAAFVSLPVMGSSSRQAVQVMGRTLATLRWSILTISSIIGFAYIMNFSGMAITLGRAFAATGCLFPFFSPFLGWLGVFMTGTDTSSNALFGKLQQVTASQIGVNPVILVSANTTGGVCGKMISQQSLSVATAATGLEGREAEIFRFTCKHSLILVTAIAVITVLQVYVIQWVVP